MASDKFDLTFYDNYIPPLKAGAYQITAGQQLTAKPEGNPVPKQPQADLNQKFIVRGPRFNLDPADVHHIYPPKNTSGRYHEYLPIIVFNKRALPWERELNLKSVTLPKGIREDNYPWLALLVFDENELILPKVTDEGGKPLDTQQNQTRVSTVPLKDVVNIDAAKGIRGPNLSLGEGENKDKDRCQVIDLPVEKFQQLIPSLEDARLLSHVRYVVTDHKAPQKSRHDGWHSVVIGNRPAVSPPQDSTSKHVRNIVHLVSLEGFEDLLQIDGPPSKPGACTTVRMISLYNWTYSCIADDQGGFANMMKQLVSPQSQQDTELLFRMPLPPVAGQAATEAQKTVVAQMKAGYIPLSHALPSGEQTFAWYRGPLTPKTVPRFLETTDPGSPENAKVPLNAAEAMIFDPKTGVFDQSYATAWETGRLMALASKPFSTNLLYWRKKAHHLVDVLLERIRSPFLQSKLLAEQMIDANGNLTAAGTKELAGLLDAHLVTQNLKDFLAGRFADAIAKKVGIKGGFKPTDGPLIPPPSAEKAPQTQNVPGELKDLMQLPAVRKLLEELSGLWVTPPAQKGAYQASIMSQQIIEWLANLTLMYGVPFNNLVPDPRMLPLNSIRFFYIDRNWIDAAIDGALSVGIQSSRDRLFHQLMRDPLHRAVEAALHKVRDKLRGISSDTQPHPAGQIAGFLLRSSAVLDWPGLEIKAYLTKDAAEPVKPLRLDRISPNILIGLYPGAPVKLEFREPAEGLMFGQESNATVVIKYVTGPDKGKPSSFTCAIDGNIKRDQPAGNPAFNIGGESGLVAKLNETVIGNTEKIGPAAFAVQLIKEPEKFVFSL